MRIRFNEPLENCSRHSVEEEVEKWIGDSGEVVGGGVATDGCWAHIDLNVSDDIVAERGMASMIDQLRSVLRAAKVPSSTKIVIFENEDSSREFLLGQT
jgi:hypothetical protein